MFCRLEASDEDMLEWLKQEQFKITRDGLVRIRKDLGLRRMKHSQAVPQHMDEKLQEMVMEDRALSKNPNHVSGTFNETVIRDI